MKLRYYLVGIKGTGMSALAQLLKDDGHLVHGSDDDKYFFTEDKLKMVKIPIYIFDKNNIDGKDVYIISNAYDHHNIEVKEIINNDYEYYYYHNFIGIYLRKKMICISGTHGKTTTTSLMTQMLGGKCSYIIGDGSGKGGSKLMILEACEYKNHFHSYYPEVLVITNIGFDHPDFFKSEKDVIQSFNKMASHSGQVILNIDDKNCEQILHDNIITYGRSEKADYQFIIEDVTEEGYQIILKNNLLKTQTFLKVDFVGYHMIYNFIAAYVACLTIDENPLLHNLYLPKRRMTEYLHGETILIDDYAHHPTEINCLYQALKQKYPEYPIKVIFQPHTYSRTLKFKKEFKAVLQQFDHVYLCEVFSSKRELKNAYEELKVRKIFKNFPLFSAKNLDDIKYDKKEIWLFLGAGIANQYIGRILGKNN